jgi:hypothetical protein
MSPDYHERDRLSSRPVARREVSSQRTREAVLVSMVLLGAIAAAAYHYVGLRWPWLLGEPARERIGALLQCEAEGLEIEAVAVPSAVTWPAAPVYDALRLRVRPAGGVIGHELPMIEEEDATVIATEPLPDAMRAPLRACVEREHDALVASVATITAREGATPAPDRPIVVRP